MDSLENKPTLTVLILAYNEETSIKRSITSVISQTQENYTLSKILIINDGSTDKTVDNINMLQDDRITIITHVENKGNQEAVNTGFANTDSDYCFKLDGDLFLLSNTCLDILVKQSLEENLRLIHGKQIYPESPKNLLESYVYTIHQKVYKEKLITSLSGDQFLQHHILGDYLIHRDIYRECRIPIDILSEDVFIFYYSRSKGFDTGYSLEAITSFAYPLTWKQHIKQLLRWDSPNIQNHFSKKFIQKYNRPFPKTLLSRVLLQAFIQHPLHTSILFITRFIVLIKKPFYRPRRTWKEN